MNLPSEKALWSEEMVEVDAGRVLNQALRQGYSTAVWRRPGAEAISMILTKNEVSLEATQPLEELKSGFLLAPFLPGSPRTFLPAEIYLTTRQGTIRLVDLPEELKSPESGTYWHTKPEPVHEPIPYQQLVEQACAEIGLGTLRKVVASRTRHLPVPDGFDPWLAFTLLANRYPHALISLTSTTAWGTWLGATPELLVEVENDTWFRTVALAGTQPYTSGMDIKGVAWTQKEIEEQALVERYIIACFKKIRLREYEENGPRTVIAGNLLHLKSEFTVNLRETNFPQLGSVMLNLLHPTSAVCGTPREEALEFLKKYEGYERQLYAGYLGPVHLEGHTSLYVNLRCLQLTSSALILYAGAGITEDSQPAKEESETSMKMDTIGKVVLPHE